MNIEDIFKIFCIVCFVVWIAHKVSVSIRNQMVVVRIAKFVHSKESGVEPVAQEQILTIIKKIVWKPFWKKLV